MESRLSSKQDAVLRRTPVLLAWLLALARVATLVLFVTQRRGALLQLLRPLFTCLTLVVIAMLLLAGALLWGVWQGLAGWF
ncbi:MAG: hypothetical protein WAU00_15320 [Caldilinea sp.]|uniref:hypothetical protein n=1 Tax=Caldilinea sp. TaxID=2293560 RepID=UPI002C2FC39B|nr:hypothetical protein [Anaerolineales bacterium]HQY95157.1 hypothetical protein [Caldilinea sp.]